MSIGLIDALSKRCMKIREPIENHQSVVLSILACLGLLTKFTDVCPKGLFLHDFLHSIFCVYVCATPKKKIHSFPESSASKLLTVVKSTELFGTISLLYATIVPVGMYCFGSQNKKSEFKMKGMHCI